MPEPAAQHDATPLTWHEAADDLATPPYDSTEVAAIVDAWTAAEARRGTDA